MRSDKLPKELRNSGHFFCLFLYWSFSLNLQNTIFTENGKTHLNHDWTLRIHYKQQGTCVAYFKVKHLQQKMLWNYLRCWNFRIPQFETKWIIQQGVRATFIAACVQLMNFTLFTFQKKKTINCFKRRVLNKLAKLQANYECDGPAKALGQTSSQKLGRHASHLVRSEWKSSGRVSFGSKFYLPKYFYQFSGWIISRKYLFVFFSIFLSGIT